MDICYGFADEYLFRCNEESKSYDDVNKEVYTMLVELERRLRTKEETFSVDFQCTDLKSRLQEIKKTVEYIDNVFREICREPP